MQTAIIGQLAFDSVRLQQDINTILTFEFSQEYQYYALGNWECCVLWNRTGKKQYVFLEQYSSLIQPTELGLQLPYIKELLQAIFNIEYLKLARIFSVYNNGVLVPHRDFIEFDPNNAFTRIHVPLQTNAQAYNSEDEHIYQLQRGEIWYLNAACIHSAANFCAEKRLNLVLDFQPGVAIADLFNNKACYAQRLGMKPREIARLPLTTDYLAGLYQFATVINEFNFKDIVAILAKVHFFRNVPVGEMFTWLRHIAVASANPKVIAQAQALERACLETREAPVAPN